MLSMVKQPYLQWPTENSIKIIWETFEDSTSTVKYSETARVHSGLNGQFRTEPATEKTVDAPGHCRIHAVTLGGLRPDTTYHYQVVSANAAGEVVQSDPHPCKTAVSKGTPLSFAVTSETGGYGDDEINRKIFRQIRRYRPEFVLLVGDAVARGSRYEDWGKYLFAPGQDLFADTPFYHCPGNHEENADWMHRFIAYPGPENYYAFDYGDAHFVALDSTSLVDFPDGKPVATEELEPGSAQLRFLADDLKSSSADWKFVFFHYPPYVSGDYQVEQLRRLCPLFEEHGVDLVFNSHTIVYERSHPLRGGRVDMRRGTTYVVAGGAGAMPNWLHPKRAWHTAQSLATPHFVQVIVAGPVLELNAIDCQGHTFDTLKLTKR